MRHKTKHPLYSTWCAMINRCRHASHYRRRGITVCKRWLDDFDAFVADVGPKPSSKHSLDRYPNRKGNYEPGNVRWATASEQVQNQDRKRRAEYGGTISTYVDEADGDMIIEAARHTRKTVSAFLRDATLAEAAKVQNKCHLCGRPHKQRKAA